MRVSLFLDHDCNLRCSYCYNGEKFHRSMTWEVARRAVSMALESPAPRRISFFGGEPLLKWELLKGVHEHASQEASRRDVDCARLVVTNATLLTPDRLQYLLHEDIHVAVSVDGCREAHDATRRATDGTSTYDVVVRNVRPLLEDRPWSKVICVLHPRNVEHMARSLDALIALGARNISMNVDYGADWTEASRASFVGALRRLTDRWADLYRQGLAFRLNLLDSKVVTWVKAGFSLGDRCDFGCEEVAVSPLGRLYPCDRLVGEDAAEDLVIGDVWRGVDHARRDRLIAEKNRELSDCEGCALLPRCMHWCGCVNHQMTGAVGEVSGLLCWFEQRIIEEADRAAGSLAQEGVPAFFRRFYPPRRSG